MASPKAPSFSIESGDESQLEHIKKKIVAEGNLVVLHEGTDRVHFSPCDGSTNSRSYRDIVKDLGGAGFRACPGGRHPILYLQRGTIVE